MSDEEQKLEYVIPDIPWEEAKLQLMQYPISDAVVLPFIQAADAEITQKDKTIKFWVDKYDNRVSEMRAEITRLKEELDAMHVYNSRAATQIKDLEGQLAGEVCNMCNWLERGDCYEEKQRLKEELRQYRMKVARRNGFDCK